VYSPAKEKGAMARVLLGPNLVFEASRSSLDEPTTKGPKATDGAPDLPDALGHAVDIAHSSLLLRYLADHNTTAIAPVSTRRWAEQACTPGHDGLCPKGTWLERLYMMKAAGAPGGDVPTAGLAVRTLGVDWRPIDVVVRKTDEPGRLEVAPRRSPSEASECPGARVDVPVITFSAEVVSLQDGRILARIHEVQPMRTSVPTRRSVIAQSYEWQGPRAEQEWKAVNVLCKQLQPTSEALRAEIRVASMEDAKVALAALIKAGLDPLY
jgi:hypothetical protein